MDNKFFYKKTGVGGLKKIADEFEVHDDIVFATEHSKKEDEILDLGCGYGRVSFALARAGYQHVTGIDLAENLITSAKKDAQAENFSIRFDVGDMVSLPYANEVFNKVFCFWNTFNEIFEESEQIKTLNEVYRVLKPNGEAFFTMIDGESEEVQEIIKQNNIDPMHPIILRPLNGIDHYQYAHTRASLQKLVKGTLFTKSNIGFIHLHQRQRIVMSLTK